MVLNCYARTMLYESHNTSGSIHDEKFIYGLVNGTIAKFGGHICCTSCDQ